MACVYNYRMQQIIHEIERLIPCEGVDWFVQLQQWANLVRFAAKEVRECGADMNTVERILHGPFIALQQFPATLGRKWSQEMAMGFRQSGIAPPTDALIRQVLAGLLEQMAPIRKYFGMENKTCDGD